jgi:lipoyl(octanoyl) transferase
MPVEKLVQLLHEVDRDIENNECDKRYADRDKELPDDITVDAFHDHGGTEHREECVSATNPIGASFSPQMIQEPKIDLLGPIRKHEPLWRIEVELDCPGLYNMERDEEITRDLIEHEESPNCLRLYSWKPWALSVGYQQSKESIDAEACRKAGIDLVRRPTGGRAVLHANELTYAVAMRSDASDGIADLHNKIALAILHGLRELGNGEELMITSGSGKIRDAYTAGELTNLACFASIARHEVTFRGRKIMGSAQRRFGGVVLQHGSIPLGPEHLRLPEFMAISDDRKAAMSRLLGKETATLSDVFGRTIGVEEAADCVARHFVEHICS